MSPLPIINGVLLLAAAASVLAFQWLPTLFPGISEFQGVGGADFLHNAGYAMIGTTLCFAAHFFRRRHISAVISLAVVAQSINF
jgi:hypothetical protein